MGESIGTVGGLTIHKRGEYLEKVELKSGSFGLVHSEPDLEFIEFFVEPKEMVSVSPYDDPAEGGTESYRVLEGSLVVEGKESVVLRVGDSFVARDLSETVNFIALEPTLLLGTFARPNFHMISSEMSDLMRMAVAVEEKDGYTGEHCERLQRYSVAVGRHLGLPHSRVYMLSIGAYLHDLGKIRVPDSILGKAGPLTDDEWKVMRQHPTWGRELLAGTFLATAGPILEQHHERLDGSGYPFGLKADAIWVESTIVAVADTYDAITTDRPYRKGATPAEAIAELRKFAIVHYPERVIDALEAVLRSEGLVD